MLDADQPSHPSVDADSATLDPADTLRLIQAQQEKVRRLEPDGRLLYGSWGIAWLVGFLTLYFSRNAADRPANWAFVIFFALLGSAMALSIVHSIRATRGVRGESARAGMMYGWSWTISFVAYGFIIWGLGRAGASGVVIALAANGLACAVAGVQYLAAGAMFQDIRSYLLGVWILLVGALGTFVGIDFTYQVMAVLGGGGLLVMAGIEQVLRLRRRRMASDS
jgi:hypothetical protein